MSRGRHCALILAHVGRVVLTVAGVGLLAVAGWAQDLPTVAMSAEADEVTEGTPAIFTLTRSGVTEGAVAVTVAVSATDGLLLADTPPFSTEVVALVDDVELGRAVVTVTTLGAEFLRGAAGECLVADFPRPGETVTLEWQQTQQNFVITDRE